MSTLHIVMLFIICFLSWLNSQTNVEIDDGNDKDKVSNGRCLVDRRTERRLKTGTGKRISIYTVMLRYER